jgi:DNA polymerase III alpha subunit (gram-positive type)
MDFCNRPLIVTDTETSGLDPARHELIEIGAIKLDPMTLEETGRFERRVMMRYPETAEAKALEVNGYSPDLWADATTLIEAMYDFQVFSKDGVFVAHNVAFDWAVIQAAFRRTAVKNLMDYHQLDLPSMAWMLNPHRKSFRMSAISEDLGIPPEPTPHRAINGALQAARVLRLLRNEYDYFCC